MNRTFNDLIYELLRAAEDKFELSPDYPYGRQVTLTLLEIRKIAHENGVY